MKYDHSVIVDGHIYKAGEEVPDLGSLECISADGNIREYRGFSKDHNKLPKYDDLATGSSVIFNDTGEYEEYNRPTKTWNPI